MYLSIEKQLKHFVQKHDISKDLEHRFNREKDNDVISDIYDGQMYKSLGNGILTSDRNAMSLSFSCDGVPVFESSNFSIWPLQGMLNELPPQKRKQNIFLIGLWFGSSKPNILEYLEPFTSEMRRLGSVGTTWMRDGVEFARRCLLASAHVTLLQGLFSKIFISSMANVAVVGVITQGLGCRRVRGIRECICLVQMGIISEPRKRLLVMQRWHLQVRKL